MFFNDGPEIATKDIFNHPEMQNTGHVAFRRLHLSLHLISSVMQYERVALLVSNG